MNSGRWLNAHGMVLAMIQRITPSPALKPSPSPAGLTPADTMPKTQEDGINVDTDHEQTPIPAQVSDATAQHHADAIAAAAFKLNQLRENWLNPPDWVDWVITPEEAKTGFPKRPQAKPGHEADLKKRTLTNLYNAKPAWLVNAHQALDKTVALAYGWDDYTADMPDAEILQGCYSSIWPVLIKPRVEKMHHLSRRGPCPRLIFSRGHGPLLQSSFGPRINSKVASRSVLLEQENEENFLLSKQFAGNKRSTTPAILLCWL